MEQLNTFMEMTGYTGDGIKLGLFVVFLAGLYHFSKEQDDNPSDNASNTLDKKML